MYEYGKYTELVRQELKGRHTVGSCRDTQPDIHAPLFHWRQKYASELCQVQQAVCSQPRAREERSLSCGTGRLYRCAPRREERS
jgi:hypothetical protein